MSSISANIAGMNSDAAIGRFLAEAGWGDAALAPLAGDASNRRYLRLTRGAESAVLMDAPPAQGEDIRPFIAVTEFLLAQGFSAPRLLAADPEKGLLLLEDLGDALYARHLTRAPEDEGALYGAAVDLLASLAEIPPPSLMGAAGLPLAPYDRDTLLREAALFAEWWLPATGCSSAEMATDFAGLMETAISLVAEARGVVALRDYHAENLLWLPSRTGLARVGLIDYQDALAGHAAYDLVSLLEDARRDTASELRDAMIARYLAARPGVDPQQFRVAYAVLGAQRNLKIIGIFARLAERDGKLRYLSMVPRVWAHLQRDLSHPLLAELRDWIKQHVVAPDAEILARMGPGASAGAGVPA